MATAICASLRRRGFRVAPFKAQNMSNNSYPCADGSEIGRAQVAQAEACGIAPTSDMNPILLKPNAALGCQIVLDGRVWKTAGAGEYQHHFDYLLQRVLAAYERLAREYEYIVIEGAGSVVEMNLKERDLVNLGFASRVEAPGLLVADIDRGGVFASIVGTFALLDEAESKLMRSFAVNRFRGDPALFEDGVKILERRTNKPCCGVFPMAFDITLDAEDGVSLEEQQAVRPGGPAVAIVRLPHISNFTDFRLLGPYAEWVIKPLDRQFDFVFLPGTKNTIDDLTWLRASGLADWVLAQHRAGARIIGICGGYQMMGERVDDPEHFESHAEGSDGLGLLPVNTLLKSGKTVRTVEAITSHGTHFQAYEIHMGETQKPHDCEPFATLSDGTGEGIRQGLCQGTYLHGALESAEVLNDLLGTCFQALPAKSENYVRLAGWFEKHARHFDEIYL
jgi:adenosylcobyric acid synthase